MNQEEKAAMDEGYDMIVELMEFIKDSQSTAPRQKTPDRYSTTQGEY
jgi:hypothetical protein